MIYLDHVSANTRETMGRAHRSTVHEVLVTPPQPRPVMGTPLFPRTGCPRSFLIPRRSATWSWHGQTNWSLQVGR